jgi:hypothetical protein
MSATTWFHPAFAPDSSPSTNHLLFATLTVKAISFFVYRLLQTLTFNDFTFFDRAAT